MRIMVLARGIPGPDESLRGIFERDQALALQRAGHEVIVAVLDARSIRHHRRPGLSVHTGSDRIDGLDVIRLDVPLGAVPPRLDHVVHAQAARRLHDAVVSQWGRPDVVHAHFARFAAAAARAGLTGPLAWTEHDSHVRAPDRRLREDIEVAAGRADAVICVSEDLSRRLDEDFGVRSRVVPNIVDVDLFDRPARPHSGSVVVAVGALIPGKGMVELAHAARRVPGVELRIIGAGPQRRELEAMRDPGIVLLGRQPRERIAEEMAGADVFALASHGETFGVACAEAMAAGLPVLTTTCGGPEGFVDGTSGVLVAPGDVNELTRGLRRILAGRWDRDHIREVARSRFSAPVVVAELEETYRDMGVAV